MTAAADQHVEVYRMHPATLWVSSLVALLLQTFLPLKFRMAQLIDFPLLVTVYFALVRRNKVFGIGFGTALGLLQDALAQGFIGISGMAKSVIGYLAASWSIRFELESVLARAVLTGVFVLVHNLIVAGLRHALLETPPPFEPLTLATSVLVNVALGLIVFLALDRFRHPA